MVIGVTGKSCAGKDFICQILSSQNSAWHEINLDAIGHLALEQKEQAVLKSFPELHTGTSKKKIDRKKLGHLVFCNPTALHRLEAILHPCMRKLVLEQLSMQEESINFIINAALLEKLELLLCCNLVLWVQAPVYLRAWRAMRRDKLSFAEFLQRDKAQRNLVKPASSQKTPPYYSIKNNCLFNSCNLNGIYTQLKRIPQLRQEFFIDR